MELAENIIPLTASQRAHIKQVAEAATAGPTQAMVVQHGMSAEPCQYAVVSQVTGKEVIRCWSSAEAVYYAAVDPNLALGTLAYVEALEAEVRRLSTLEAANASLKEELAEQEREKLALVRASLPQPYPATTPPDLYEHYFCQAGDDVLLLFWGYPRDEDGLSEEGAELGWQEYFPSFGLCPTEHVVSGFWLHPKAYDPSAQGFIKFNPNIPPATLERARKAVAAVMAEQKPALYQLTAEELGPEFFQTAKQKLAALPRHAWGSPKTCDYDRLALTELVAGLLAANYTSKREAYLSTPSAAAPLEAAVPAADWFSPLVFDSQGQYDASVADVCRRIESGEITPRQIELNALHRCPLCDESPCGMCPEHAKRWAAALPTTGEGKEQADV